MEKPQDRFVVADERRLETGQPRGSRRTGSLPTALVLAVPSQSFSPRRPARLAAIVFAFMPRECKYIVVLSPVNSPNIRYSTLNIASIHPSERHQVAGKRKRREKKKPSQVYPVCAMAPRPNSRLEREKIDQRNNPKTTSTQPPRRPGACRRARRRPRVARSALASPPPPRAPPAAIRRRERRGR